MKSYTTNSIDPRGREGTNRNNLKFCFLSRELLRFETRTPSTHKKKRRLNIKSRVYTVAPVRPTLRKRRKMKKKKRKKCATSRKRLHCLIVYSLDSREVLEFYLMCIYAAVDKVAVRAALFLVGVDVDGNFAHFHQAVTSLRIVNNVYANQSWRAEIGFYSRAR